MTWSVYQHWDPLKVCAVGRSYPPEFYSWISVPHVRSLFEQIATETEEDYQNIIKKLEEFNVQVIRPNLPSQTFVNGAYQKPPMCPRDIMIMIGNTFYENCSFNFKDFYSNIRDSSWPECESIDDIKTLPRAIQDEIYNVYMIDDCINNHNNCYSGIIDIVKQQGNTVKSHVHHQMNGAYIARIGRDLYFGTENYDQHPQDWVDIIAQEFKTTRNHVVNTGGHSDGTYCPVCPGLIISLRDVPHYKDTFPGWEVVWLPNQSWSKVRPFLDLKKKNKGKWWIPGFEQDQAVIDTVETWLDNWVGYVEETVFDVNMLIIDPKNVMVFNYNEQVFDALDRYGITPHVVPFRHRYFWDGGIHCVTADLHRHGAMQDFFRGKLMFDKILKFETALAEYTGAPYAVMTDCCTHAIEMCLRYDRVREVVMTPYTYLSIPMTMHKLGIKYYYKEEEWVGEYRFHGTRIWDCARRLEKNMYRTGQMQCLSFGNGKPLHIGRGGAILLDDHQAYNRIIRMRYDGRDLNILPWQNQQVFNVGYHYKPTLEEAELGSALLQGLIDNPKEPVYVKYPDCRNITIED